MKHLLLITSVLLLSATCPAQNPFATTNFYNAIKKVYADGEKGFPATKGAYRNEAFSFYFEYQIKTLLPGADSGKVSMPQVIGYPFATYYFTAGKTLSAAKATEARLKAALRSAWSTPLIEIQKNDTIKAVIFYKTFFYKTPEAVKKLEFIFDTYLVAEKGTYTLALNINGNTDIPATPKAPAAKLAEADIDQKIKQLLVSMDKMFADEKAAALSKNQYYTEYESRTALYGQKCTLKDRGFEISFRFFAGSKSLSGPDEAKTIYDKLFTALSATGRFSFKPAVKESYRNYVVAFENVADAWKSKVTLVLEYYDSPYLPSVSLLLTRKEN